MIPLPILMLLVGLAAPVAAQQALVERGKYLAQAGDCIACHTVPGAKIFSGNRAMPTPFGKLYAPNITPDAQTGIGSWSADDFFKMMRTGRSKNGDLLYPAMPFASYTKVTRADSDAIYAYLRSVPAVRQASFKTRSKLCISVSHCSRVHSPPSKWPQPWLAISWPSPCAFQTWSRRALTSSTVGAKPTLERPAFRPGAL